MAKRAGWKPALRSESRPTPENDTRKIKGEKPQVLHPCTRKTGARRGPRVSAFAYNVSADDLSYKNAKPDARLKPGAS